MDFQGAMASGQFQQPSFGLPPSRCSVASAGMCGAPSVGTSVSVTVSTSPGMQASHAMSSYPMMAPASSYPTHTTVIVTQTAGPMRTSLMSSGAPSWQVPRPPLEMGMSSQRSCPAARYAMPERAAKASTFQIMERGAWTEVGEASDLQLKRAFLAGFPSTTYGDDGHVYRADFSEMTCSRLSTGETFELRVPFGWKAPAGRRQGSAKAFSEAGPDEKPTMMTLGDALQKLSSEEACRTSTTRSAPPSSAKPGSRPSKYSTGQKAAAGLAGAAVVGGAAFAGGVATAGEVSGEGWREAFEHLGGVAEDIGEDIGGNVVDAGEAALDAAADEVAKAGDTVGDFVADLF